MKKIFLGLVCLALIGAAALFVVTRNTPASHPGLRAGDLPPLIPTRSFFADPRSEYAYVPSADGAYTLSEKASLLGRSSVVREVGSGEIVAEFPADLSAVRWHPSLPRLRFILEGEDWEADIFAPARETWTRTSPVRLSGGWALDEYATDPGQNVLFWGRENNRSPGHMWRVSQDGRTAERVATGSAETIFWVFDHAGAPRLRIDARDDYSHTVLRKDGADWTELFVWNLNDHFQPLGKIDAAGRMLARSSRGRDKIALVELDIATGAETVLHANPNGDIGLTATLTYDGGPDVLRLGVDTLERVALSPRGQTFLDVLDSFPQPITLGYTAPSPSGRYVAQAISAQERSWIYLLIDLEEGAHEILGEYHFRRFAPDLVQGEAVTFAARDGLDIPAILTRPKGVSGPVPFIIKVHGGPAGHIPLGYDHETQLLANRGYGVLAVNFRGSTGFGKAFQAAGFKAFGRAMQDDLADAARWLVDQGLADADNLGILGASYGGYAAALAMTRDPGVFDAAISEFPLLDVEFQSRFHPGFWSDGMNGWWRYFGQIDQPEDLADMRRFSPVNRVGDLHGPLMVIGGLNDQITAVQQVRDFADAAQAAGRPVSVHIFDTAGHGVQHWRDELRRARLIEDFFAQHLGGRSGGFELVERAPEFID